MSAYKIQYRHLGSNPRAAEARTLLTEFLTDAALYAKTPIESELLTVLLELLYLSGFKFDAWCVDCSKPTTFTCRALIGSDTRSTLSKRLALSAVVSIEHSLDLADVHANLRWLTFACARDGAHKMHFVCRLRPQYDPKTMQVKHYDLLKIGQEPSPADIAKQQIRKYANTLDAPYFAEFNRAIGLASHGIGIGSFVYLRRIFERLVEETLCESEPDVSRQAAVRGLRMDEKIAALSAHLPTFLVQNKVLYKILSKGVHELEEQQCLAAFEPVKIGIELILDERIEKKNREKKIEEAARSLAELRSSLGAPKE